MRPNLVTVVALAMTFQPAVSFVPHRAGFLRVSPSASTEQDSEPAVGTAEDIKVTMSTTDAMKVQDVPPPPAGGVTDPDAAAAAAVAAAEKASAAAAAARATLVATTTANTEPKNLPESIISQQDKNIAMFSSVNKVQKAPLTKPVADPKSNLPKKSVAVPFLDRPPLLTGELAGDSGFDPLGFADSEANLKFYADAEVKHGRLAMLCAAGWPLSELWHPQLAEKFSLTDLTAAGGRAPSVLNGGLFDQPNGLVGVGLLLGLSAIIELPTVGSADTGGTGWGEEFGEGGKAKVAGDRGFDPFGLYNGYSASEDGKKNMRLAEIKNGRAAMMAVLAYVVEEASTGKPVTQITPVLFAPFYKVVLGLMGATAFGDDAQGADLQLPGELSDAEYDALLSGAKAAAAAAPAAIEAAVAPAQSLFVEPVAQAMEETMVAAAAVIPAAVEAVAASADGGFAAPMVEAATAAAAPIADAVAAAAAPITEAAVAAAPAVAEVLGGSPSFQFSDFM